MQFQSHKTGYFQVQDFIMPGYEFTEEEVSQMGRGKPDRSEPPEFAQGGFIVFVLIICYMVSKVI